MESIVTTKIRRDIRLREFKGGIRFGTDTLFLAHFCGGGKRGVDLGSGNGALSLLLLASGKAGRMTGIEISRGYAGLSVQNAAENGFGAEFDCLCRGVEDIPGAACEGAAGIADFAVSNPPYIRAGCGRAGRHPLKHIAFHETTADIYRFCAAASFVLKPGGYFYLVYRPEHGQRLFHALELSGIKPKILRYVYPSAGKKPRLMLVMGEKDGMDGMDTLPPLFIYADGAHEKYSAEMEGIYHELV